MSVEEIAELRRRIRNLEQGQANQRYGSPDARIAGGDAAHGARGGDIIFSPGRPSLDGEVEGGRVVFENWDGRRFYFDFNKGLLLPELGE